MKTKLIIEGMSCGHCVKHVKEALEEIDTVQNVDVNLENKTATFDSNISIDEGKIKFAIEDAGYEVIKIEVM